MAKHKLTQVNSDLCERSMIEEVQDVATSQDVHKKEVLRLKAAKLENNSKKMRSSSAGATSTKQSL